MIFLLSKAFLSFVLNEQFDFFAQSFLVLERRFQFSCRRTLRFFIEHCSQTSLGNLAIDGGVRQVSTLVVFRSLSIYLKYVNLHQVKN